jgi:hypothetical protein
MAGGESYEELYAQFDTIFFLYLVPPILFEATTPQQTTPVRAPMPSHEVSSSCE